MTDSESQSPPPARKGFERRWIKNANYTGPERRSGVDRRRYPPLKEGERATRQDPGDGPNSVTEKPPGSNSSGNFKPFHP
ncbi:MAG: hypothetical protein P8010_14545 [Desulfosarcinaceae bacterium]|jgi:hypothetical protein